MDLLVHIVNYINVQLKIYENFIVGQDWILGQKLYIFRHFFGQKCISGEKIFYRIESRKT